MKSIFPSPSVLVAVFVAAAALTGCAAIQEEHRQHHPESTATESSGSMGRSGSAGPTGMVGGASPDGQKGMMGGGAGGQMGMMDRKSMCEMHDKMMNAKTPAERTAMMDDRMKNMSPEERQKHMEMMKQQCK